MDGWVRGVKLGHGSFATVNLAAARSQSSGLPPLMAVKTCGFWNSSALVNEKLILDELSECPEIVRCFGESVSYENGEKLYNVLLEYATGGDLAGRIRNCGDRGLPEMEVRRYTKALLRGLNYVHKIGFVHCDVKLQNILLCENGAVKIADFGLARRITAGNGFNSGCELRGTPLYMSPEMVAGGEVGTAADIWAAGCVVAEMAAGAPAWKCGDLPGLLMRIGAGDELPAIPDWLSADGKDFLGKCFVKDPRKRWTAEMLLNHPFISGQDFEERQETTASASPRCIFDFPDWGSSSAEGSITFMPSPESNLESRPWSSEAAAGRLLEMVGGQAPNWSVTDDWVTVR